MDKEEGHHLLKSHIDEYSCRGWHSLSTLIGHLETGEVTAESGAIYQFEIEILWDNRPGGDIRVVGSIDDHSFSRTVLPLTLDDLVTKPSA
jgi:hypothetical protein